MKRELKAIIEPLATGLSEYVSRLIPMKRELKASSMGPTSSTAVRFKTDPDEKGTESPCL